MARDHAQLVELLLLRNGAATAVTANTADAAKNNARIQNMKSGVALVLVSTIDVSSNDEVYTITIEGRDTVGAGGWTVLGTLILAATPANVAGSVQGAAGLFKVSVDQIKKEMRSNLVVAGTTPSILHHVMVVSEEPKFQPAQAATITA